MLKKLRVVFAAFFMVALTLLFLDYTGTVHAWLGWSAKVQFVPAALAGSAAVVAGLVLLTLFFGRIYCSAVCPLGIFQDVVSRLPGIGKKNRYSYRPPRVLFTVLRFAILGLFIFALAASVPLVTALIEPYSAYGRMVSQLFGPLYQWGNNVLAYFAERADSYAFYTVDVWLRSAAALIIAAVTFVVITVFAWKSGRGYCNTICPVGTLLAVITRFSFVKQPIDVEKCGSCGLCAKNCKAGCIDPVAKRVDFLRCVSCGNCIAACPKKAVGFSLRNPLKASSSKKGSPDMKTSPDAKTVKASSDTKTPSDANVMELSADSHARRGFVAGAAALALGFAARAFGSVYNFDGGLAPLEDKKTPERTHPIIPPGAGSIRNLRRRCTGCQLCVTACANHVLRPSNSVSGFMQPHMSFERGYCRPECVKCSSVCPTGAIRPITAEEKSATQIGVAVWTFALCVVNRDGVSCDRCERACPTGAITMISRSAIDQSSPKIPMIDTARCIGCGACEHLCPSRPYSAIHVNGIDVHRVI